eukprot:12420541-Karenia_brevis.AAC.1
MAHLQQHTRTAKCARKSCQKKNMRQDCGSIVFSETLNAKIVQRKHFSVQCAKNFFQSQNMSTNSGAIVFNEKQAVE